MAGEYFSADLLARYRERELRAMPDTCSISGSAAGSGGIDEHGAPADGGATATGAVPCRFDDALASMDETLRAMRLTGTASAVLYVPLGTAVGDEDRITYRGTTYEIAGTNAGQSYATSLAIALRKT